MGVPWDRLGNGRLCKMGRSCGNRCGVELYGRYVLIERIGSGGMAEVFRGLAVGKAGFARTMAVKRLLPHMAQDPEVVRMLVEEARLASAIRHPNVIQVMDLGQQDNTYFMAMEYVAGCTLTRLVNVARERAGMPQPMAVAIMRDALRGLAHAHALKDENSASLNLIHRDISPDNIMVGFDGRVLLMDFGVARAEDQARVTLAGSLRGKPAYMSPEVVRGGPVTQDVDLYAAGVVLFEVLAMSPMRTARSDVAMLSEVSRGEVPTLESRGVTVPPGLSSVVQHALSADPDQRPPSAAAFAAALDNVANSVGALWTSAETAAWMRHHLPEEAEREAEAEARDRKLARQMGGASPRALARMVAAANGTRLGPPAWLWVVAAVVMLAAGGGLAVLLRPAPPPMVAVSPPPPADTPPAQPAPVLAPKTVAITSKPDGATVSLGDKPMGTTPVELNIPPGQSREVTVEKAGYLDQTHTFDYMDAPETWEAVLKAAGPGLLTLQTTPWGRVKVDGRDTGKFTPLNRLSLPAGRHVVEVTNDEMGVSTRFVVNIRPGRTHKEARRLR